MPTWALGSALCQGQIVVRIAARSTVRERLATLRQLVEIVALQGFHLRESLSFQQLCSQ